MGRGRSRGCLSSAFSRLRGDSLGRRKKHSSGVRKIWPTSAICMPHAAISSSFRVVSPLLTLLTPQILTILIFHSSLRQIRISVCVCILYNSTDVNNNRSRTGWTKVEKKDCWNIHEYHWCNNFLLESRPRFIRAINRWNLIFFFFWMQKMGEILTLRFKLKIKPFRRVNSSLNNCNIYA